MGRRGGASKARTAVPDKPARAQASFARRWWGKILLLLATIALLNLAFAPFKQFYLAWVALVPWMLVIVNCRSARTAFFWSWLGGIAFFTANMWWLVYVTGPGMAALMAVLGLYWAMAGAIIRGANLLQARSPKRVLGAVLLIAAVWVTFEWFHGIWPLGGLAWGYIGQSQAPALPLCQIADITGVYGISFFVAMVNAWVAMLVLRSPRMNIWLTGEGEAPAGLVILIVGAGILIYGFFRLSQHPTTPGPRVLVVQPDYPQSNSGEKSASPQEILDFHVRTTREALAKNPNVDLVVWSETMLPPINQSARDFARAHHLAVDWEEANDQALRLAREFNVGILIGGLYYENWKTKGDYYIPTDRRNSTYLYTPQGVADLRYDKIHLVPFGETLPFKSSFPPLYALFLSLSPYSEEYTLTPGPPDAMTVFQMPQGWRFVTPICFEDLDAPLLDRMLAPLDGRKRGDFIVNLTNDGWFKANEMSQHLQNAIFRSIENRAPTARSVNTGISGFIDSAGRASDLVPAGREGLSVATLMLDSRITLYARIGDVFAYLCASAAGLLLVVTLIQWWRK
jgi:apolipoprotein N-acyltransferase